MVETWNLEITCGNVEGQISSKSYEYYNLRLLRMRKYEKLETSVTLPKIFPMFSNFCSTYSKNTFIDINPELHGICMGFVWLFGC